VGRFRYGASHLLNPATQPKSLVLRNLDLHRLYKELRHEDCFDYQPDFFHNLALFCSTYKAGYGTDIAEIS
ncbi:MAG: hypothetical protein ACE5PV_24510, partial [Candidatus Poribacteria bacterium]